MIRLIEILIVLLAFLIVNPNEIFAAKNDTLRTKTSEIKVTATRLQSDELNRFLPNSVIDSSQIEKVNPVEVSEILNISPGLFIKDYGGMGGLKTLSLRGTSASQTKIYINGIDLNSSQSGTVDLSLIPASMFDNIEIIRSGNSVSYGSNSIGGTVNFISKIKTGLTANTGFGSFGEMFFNINSGVKLDKFLIGSHVEIKSSDGDFPFKVKEFGSEKEVRRTNGDFKNLSAAVSANLSLKDHLLNMFILASKSDRGVPGSVVQGRIESKNANLNESFLALIFNSDLFLNDNILKNTLSVKTNKFNYSDDEQIGIDGSKLNTEFNNFDIKYSTAYRFDWFFNQNVKIDLSYSKLNGNMLDETAGKSVDRKNLSFSYNLEKLFEVTETDNVIFNGGIRADLIDNFRPGYSPFLGLMLDISSLSAVLKANYSGNYRLPSFNEMYYLNYGTSNLKPEESNSFNTGIIFNPSDFLSIDLNAYYINTKEQIQAVPVSPVRWSAKNIGKVETYGFDVTAKLNINKSISADINYTWQSAKDKTEKSPFYDKFIAYIPQETINAFLFLNYENIESVISGNYSSFRYSLADNQVSSILDKYLTINISLSYKIKFDNNILKFNFDVKNLFDSEYQIIKNYPMPGRFFRFGVGYKFFD